MAISYYYGEKLHNSARLPDAIKRREETIKLR